MKKILFTLALCVGLLVTHSFVSAESVVWSALQPDIMAPGANGPDRTTQFLYDPMVSVTYNVRVSEVNAGGTVIRTIPSGSQVSAGTRVLYEFVPHQFEDIFWFGIGSTWDSPYGEWIIDAGTIPYTTRCAEKNKYYERAHYGSIRSSIDLFAALSVNPPVKNLSVTGTALGSCQSVSGGINKICTVTEEGSVSAEFIFEPTPGKFYPGYKSSPSYTGRDSRIFSTTDECGRSSKSYGAANIMKRTADENQTRGYRNNGDYIVSVPRQALTHTITVSNTLADSTNTPTAPTVTTAGSSCTLESPYTIQMQATDPNGDRIRYGIDWDNNGTVDQFVPPSGYVASGTTQTAARTYTTEGTKTIRIFAQDEGGLTSGSTTFSFDCTAASIDTDDTDETLLITTGGTGGGGTGSGSLVDLSLRAIPSLVPPGERTRVHWSSINADSCTVTAPNGDSWNDIQSPVGGESSSPITEETIYTLRCLDASGAEYTQTARVNVLPLWSEF